MSRPAAETCDLWDSLDQEWVKLPLAVMQDVGPAVQTLGGLLRLTDRETFRQVAAIADRARLPLRTVQKHLGKLDAGGWIVRNGRERTRTGNLRRTATIKIPKATRDQLSPYAVLPWWACCTIRRVGTLPWSSRAVLSVVMGQLLSFKAVVEQQDDYDAADWAGGMENLGGESRFAFSLNRLERDTGLNRETIVAAKKHLRRLRIIKQVRKTREDGGHDRDLLLLNPAFRVVITEAGNDRCYLDFKTVKGGSDFG